MSQKASHQSCENANLKVLTTSSSESKEKQGLKICSDELSINISESFNQIEYWKSDKPFVIARFIFECGSKLEAKVLTVSTALKLLHVFNRSSKSPEYDPYLISAACLYLAGKIEDNDHLRLRDIINVVHTTIHHERY